MRLAGFRVPVERLSFSALATFMTCPEQFRLERLAGLKSRRGLSGFVGSVHHGAVARLLQEKMAHDEPHPDYAFTAAWQDAVEEEEPEWSEEPEAVASNGRLMLDSFLATAFPDIEPVDVETWVEDTIPGVLPLVGRVDCWEQTLTREFKTAGQKVSEPKAKWRMQARIYQLFTGLPTEFTVTTRQVTPITYTPDKLPALFLGLGQKDATARTVVQAVSQMNDLYDRYGATEPWPLNGLMHQYWCNYCPAGPKNPSPICPEWRLDGESTAS